MEASKTLRNKKGGRDVSPITDISSSDLDSSQLTPNAMASVSNTQITHPSVILEETVRASSRGSGASETPKIEGINSNLVTQNDNESVVA